MLRGADFKTAPMVMMIMWLLRDKSGWREFLSEEEDEFARTGRGLLHLLQYHLETHKKYTQSQVSALTLLCRRLLWYSSIRVDLRDRAWLYRNLNFGGAWRLPRPDSFARDYSNSKAHWYRRCEEGTAMAFLTKIWPFLMGDNIYAPAESTIGSKLARDREIDGFLYDRGDSFGYSLEPAGRRHPLIGIFAAQAAATSMLAPDPRPAAAVKWILHRNSIQRAGSVLADRMDMRNVRVLAGLLSAFSGIPVKEMVDVSLSAPTDLSQFFSSIVESKTLPRIVGWICSDSELVELQGGSESIALLKRYYLISLIGPSRSRQMDSRIQNQYIVSPLPPPINFLIDECRDMYGAEQGIPATFGAALVENAVTKIRSALESNFSRDLYFGEGKKGWNEKTVRTYLRRPDRIFRYFASVRCNLPPARLNLLLGEPFGPWRAASNYACVSRERLARDFEFVQRRMFRTAGWSLDEWPRSKIIGTCGAGVLNGGRIGEPGIPSVAELSAKIIPAGPNVALTAAAADLVLRLHGRRYSALLRTPWNEFVPSLESYCFVDKNLGGRRFPRLVPVARPILMVLKPVEWAGFKGTVDIPKTLDECVRKSRIQCGDLNSGRKALYTELLRIGVGDEAISTIFGHGLALTKLLGPISPIPGRWYLEQLRGILEALRIEEALPLETRQLSSPTLRQTKAARKSSQIGTEEADGEEMAIEGEVQHLRVPESEDELFCLGVGNRIAECWRSYVGSPMNLRRCLFLLVCLAGLPLKRAWLMKGYLRLDSFVERRRNDGLSDFYLMVAIPQKDRGLGIVPIPLGKKVGETCREIISKLIQNDSIASFKGRVLIGADVKEIRHILSFAESLVRPDSRVRKGTNWTRKALDVSSKFRCRMKLGALVFNALDGRAILHPNFVAVEDLFYQACGTHAPLTTFDGLVWKDPFGASARQAQRVRSLRRLDNPGGQGRPAVAMGKNKPNLIDLSAVAAHVAEVIPMIDAVGCANWFRTGKCFMATCAPRTGKKEDVERAYQRSGAKVARALLLRGKCTTGRPEHLLWPDLTERFLEIIAQRIDGAKNVVARHRIASLWWIQNILLLGCRPNEAHIIESQHLDNVGDPKVIRILGMKTDSARRTLDVSLFTAASVGQLLYQQLMIHGCWKVAREVGFPTNENRQRSLQRALNKLLLQAYGELRREQGLPPGSGTFSLNSLRHAAAFRVVQHSIRRSLWRGSLWIQLASVSTSLGHQSLVTTWSAYLGTSMIALRWPSRQNEVGEFCPLVDVQPDNSEA